MNFSWFFSKKIAFGKGTKNNLSHLIVRIGQLAVCIGIIVALITISTGVGARKAIKEKLIDFNGHMIIANYDSNNSYGSTPIAINQTFYPKFKNQPAIEHIQVFGTKSGVIRTEKSFEGVVFNGISTDFDIHRFQKFITKGVFPKIITNEVSNDVAVSEKIARVLFLDIDSSFAMVFVRDNQKPIYRKFTIKALYKTDIKTLDDLFIFGDIKHVQKINQWTDNQVGGFQVFVNDVEDLTAITKKVNDVISFKFYCQNTADKFSQITDWIKIFDTNIFIILFIMMLVVAINMTMILLILILERTHSIGMLKSMGATNWQIRKIFINYMLFIMLPGILAGNIIGIGLLLIQKYFNIIKLNSENYYISTAPVYLHWQYILLVSVFSLLISAIVLLLPSYLISKISPSKAIKFK